MTTPSTPKKLQLSKQQWLFVEAYAGDEVHAMRVAGYQGADAYLKQKGTEMLNHPVIREAIKNRSLYSAKTAGTIADREERMEMWTSIMRNEDPYVKQEFTENNIPIPVPQNVPLPLRLKASEFLGKAEQDFVDKIDMNVKHSITDIIQSSYLKDDSDMDLDAIEAEYRSGGIRSEIEVAIPQPMSLEDFI
jgi:hypothetical protein